MQLIAKLIKLFPIQTGTGKNGELKKQDIFVETDGQYPKKVCISIWEYKINGRQLHIGNLSKLILKLKAENLILNGKPISNPGKLRSQVQAIKAHPKTLLMLMNLL